MKKTHEHRHEFRPILVLCALLLVGGAWSLPVFAREAFSTSEQSLADIPAEILADIITFDISPDERSLVYEKQLPDGKRDLFLMSLVRGYDAYQEPVRLTHFGNAGKPRYSPDGEHIAFRMDDGLFLMEADGGRKQLLSEFASDLGKTVVSKPSWFSSRHVLLHDFAWPEYAEQNPDLTSHIVIRELDGDQRWIMGLGKRTGITEVTAAPRGGRFAAIINGRLTTYDLDLQDMMLLAPADAHGPLSYSPDARFIAYPREGNIHIISVAGADNWDLGKGSSPTWTSSGNLCLFLRGQGGTRELLAWSRNSARVFSFEEVLQEREQILTVLAENEHQLENLRLCLAVTARELLPAFENLEPIQKKYATIAQDEYLEKTSLEFDFDEATDGLESLEKELKWDYSSINVLLDRLRTVGDQQEYLKSNLELGANQLPFASEMSRIIADIAEAGGRIESRISNLLASWPERERELQAFPLEFAAAKARAIEGEKETRLQQQRDRAALQEKRLQNFRVTVTVLGTALVCLVVFMFVYNRYLEPRFRLRRIRKQYDMDLQDNLARVKDALNSAKSELHSEKRKSVAWSDILNKTQMALNDVFRDTHEQELNRIEKLGEFYQKVTREITSLDVSEEQKVELLESFKALMKQGMQDVEDESPFKARLRRVYSEVTKT